MTTLEDHHPALRDTASLAVLRHGVECEAKTGGIVRVMSFVRGERFFDVDDMLDRTANFFMENLRNREAVVVVPVIRQTLGYAVDTRGSTSELYRISLTVRPDYTALKNGSLDELNDFLDDLYKNPSLRLDAMKEKLELGRTDPVAITAKRLDKSIPIAKDPALNGLNFEGESEYSFRLKNIVEDSKFIKKDGMLTDDIRELMVKRIAYSGFYRAPEDKEKLATYMDSVKFQILPGCEGIIEEISGLQVRSMPAASLLDETLDQEVPDGPSA
jgi:hypothetical protein